MVAYIVLFVGLVFSLLGLCFVLRTLLARRKANASQNWPTAQGDILSTDMKTIKTRTTSSRGRRRTSYSYKPIIQYKYRVLGQEYSGDRIIFGGTTFNRTRAEELLAAYGRGTTVTVYYNPKKPSEAMLDTSSAIGWALLAVGLFFTLIGCLLLIGGVVAVIIQLMDIL
jgi:hypothetical protein